MRTVAISAIAIAALTLSACSQQTPGTASTTSSSNTAKPNSAPSVPQVTNPLDTAKFENNPCDVLSKEQAKQLANLETTDLDKAPGGMLCLWRDKNHNAITYSLVREGGLATTYKNHRADDPGYFEPVPDVAGYPAVYASLSDDRPGGGCGLVVGTSNDVVLVVGTQLGQTSPDRQNPCPLVLKAAEAAISTLKAGS